MGASRASIIGHKVPFWAPKLIPNGVQSEIRAETENRAPAAAGALPEPGWSMEAPEATIFDILSLNVVP